MKYHRISIYLLFMFLLLSLLVSACANSGRSTPVVQIVDFPTDLPAASPTTPPAEPTPTTAAPPVTQAPTATSPAVGLTPEQLNNLEYRLPIYQKLVRLVDGKFEAGSGVDYLAVNLLKPIALGNLDGDDQVDAAVLLAENGGGSGTFISLLALLNHAGQPQQIGEILVDDRPLINSLKIAGGKIILEAIIHGTDDPMCCPSFPVTETFTLGEAGLTLRRLESITPNGGQRAINITNPAAGDQVAGSIQLQGDVTIAPFENNLVYRVYDQPGNLLAEGPLMVDAANPGAFDAALDLSAIAAGTLIRLEVLDLSPADGSTLAMDSVEMLMK